ncbi:3-ketoacyl-ACP reductase [Blastomonas sp. UPD001]|uniref:3-ketoacyl-ACP reductase n=1 Tax=Blastomonas sp. UPD001 TaxID=2217673 RepID=UPI000E34E1B8|nr:3-ketoacyl-ACP reductase [Blastomonas sp. UPD001]
MTAPVAIVTGGAKGIGRSIAIELASKGFDLAIVDRLEEGEAQDTLGGVKALGRQAVFIHHDLADVGNAANVVAKAIAALGRIDCHVNNAGVQSPVRGDILDLELSHFDVVLDINLRGTFFLTQEVARWMAANEDQATYRSIHFVTSTNAVIPAPTRSAYCLSKTGLAMAAQVYALRMAPHGVHVFEIRPGTVRTDMTKDVVAERDAKIASGAVPIARWGEPEDIGKVVATLASGAMPFMTGTALFVDGGGHIRPN